MCDAKSRFNVIKKKAVEANCSILLQTIDTRIQINNFKIEKEKDAIITQHQYNQYDHLDKTEDSKSFYNRFLFL